MNAQIELLGHTSDKNVELVKIAFCKEYDEEPLRIEGTLEDVLPKLNFDYDNGFGGQRLFGYIWYTDGTWSDRGEYDGSEWWQYQRCPAQDIIVEVG